MPHPERASEALLGSTDGRRLFESAITWLRGAAETASAVLEAAR
jgi:phosphoribosylformylglycinamidine synthase